MDNNCSGNYFTYSVDMVFCIDATGSMANVIEMVKKHALNFHSDVINALNNNNQRKVVDKLRIRVIAFRDYMADHDKAMFATNFFSMPENLETFTNAVNSIEAVGGGDIPEDGLEALAIAIKSKWTQAEATRKRHVIVVWTDAPTHELGFGRSTPGYPSGMAKDFSELIAWWGDKGAPGFMDQNAKRLVLFAPDEPFWSNVSAWDSVIQYPAKLDGGMSEYDYDQILSIVAQSV